MTRRSLFGAVAGAIAWLASVARAERGPCWEPAGPIPNWMQYGPAAKEMHSVEVEDIGDVELWLSPDGHNWHQVDPVNCKGEPFTCCTLVVKRGWTETGERGKVFLS